MVAGDPHLAERVRDIPDVADAPLRLIELAASLGLPFSAKDLRVSHALIDAEFHRLPGGHVRKWL